MSASTVVLLEGPHDMATYSAVSWRLFRTRGTPPPSAWGMRLVPASVGGGEGGKQELPRIANLAAELGLAVRVVLDHDKPGADVDLIDELSGVAEMIVRLPERAAVERAAVNGLGPADLRIALQWINDVHDLKLNVVLIEDAELGKNCIWALKQKGGLHRPFIDALPDGVEPPLAVEVLQRLRGEAPSEPLVTLDAP